MAKKVKLKPRLAAKGRKRLHKLADLLEADAKNKKGLKFDMSTWGSTTDEDAQKDPISCGTRACAMGLAGLSGAFKKAGLTAKLVLDEGRYDGMLNRFTVDFKFNNRAIEGTKAASKLFGMTEREAMYLFTEWPSDMEQGAKAERKMAKRLRAFADGKRVQLNDHEYMAAGSSEISYE